jgi:hypothetical protein
LIRTNAGFRSEGSRVAAVARRSDRRGDRTGAAIGPARRSDRRGDDQRQGRHAGCAVDLGPAVHIWTARKLPGIVIPPDAAQFPAAPPE